MSLKGQAMTDKVLRGKINSIRQIEDVNALYAEAERLIESEEKATEAAEEATQKATEAAEEVAESARIATAEFVKQTTQVANALKGTASGTVVVLKDVSPLEHNIGVKLSSEVKLIAFTNQDNAQFHDSEDIQVFYPDGDYVVENKDGELITFTDGSNLWVQMDIGGNVVERITAGDIVRIKPDDESGWTAYLVEGFVEKEELLEISNSSGSSSRDLRPGDYIIEYIEEIEGEGHFSFTDGSSVVITMFTGDISIYDIDIGETVRIDENFNVWLVRTTGFSSVTLTKYGKNLFDENKDYGVGITEEHGEKVFYNTNTAQAEYLRFDITEIWDLAYSAGVKLSVSFDLKTQKAGTVNVYALGKKNVDATQFANATTEWQRFRLTFGLKYNTTGDETCRLAFFGGSYGSGVIPYIKNIQIEFGDSVSEYEPYKKPVGYLPETDGTVNGVIGNGENMTLVTDTEGVTITAEYNRDLNKAFAEIYQAIATMGAAAVTIPEEV